jgi:ribosomal subunit interface protein
MQIQVTFRDMPVSDALHRHVEERAQKLATFYDRIVRCHVVLEEPHRRSRQGKKFHVRIDLAVPGRELVITRVPEDRKEDLYAAIDDAFQDAERVIEDYVRVRIAARKSHHRPPHGVVKHVFHDRGYGFIEADDGHEIYFHQNSIVDGRFDKVSIGTHVRYAEEDGDRGPQASTVHVVN